MGMYGWHAFHTTTQYTDTNTYIENLGDLEEYLVEILWQNENNLTE